MPLKQYPVYVEKIPPEISASLKIIMVIFIDGLLNI